MDKESQPVDIEESLQFVRKQKGLPPVSDWNPPFCGDIDMRIDREGRWYYKATPILRESMVELFASVMRHDDDDCYYLVTPVEKVRIQVEDVPFIIIDASMQDDGNYLLTTNVGNKVRISQYNPIFIGDGNSFEKGMLYTLVRDRLYARANRNVYYQLINDAEEHRKDGRVELRVHCGDSYFSIGEIEEGG
ncbi:MAG: DUF1285 domain-containing protein [Endozoicomonas sp.]